MKGPVSILCRMDYLLQTFTCRAVIDWVYKGKDKLSGILVPNYIYLYSRLNLSRWLIGSLCNSFSGMRRKMAAISCSSEW